VALEIELMFDEHRRRCEDKTIVKEYFGYPGKTSQAQSAWSICDKFATIPDVAVVEAFARGHREIAFGDARDARWTPGEALSPGWGQD
jgi:hypothetical protein